MINSDTSKSGYILPTEEYSKSKLYQISFQKPKTKNKVWNTTHPRTVYYFDTTLKIRAIQRLTFI